MKKCLLCEVNEATKKNSHIVPHFLLQRIENIDGKTKRGYELGFNLGTSVKSHIGQSILPEKLEEIYDDLTAEKIEELNVHPLIEDFIFCESCETKLGIVESMYSSNIKISQIKINEVNQSKTKYELSLLFWASIIWRLGISKNVNLTLPNNLKEKLRRLLNNNLKEKLKDIDINKMRTTSDFENLNYKLLRCKDYSDKNVTYFHISTKINKPYILVIDEFILFFTYMNRLNELNKNEYFGISIDDLKDIDFNKEKTNESFLAKNDDFISSFNENLNQFSVDKWILKTQKRIVNMLKKLPIPADKNIIAEEIYNEIINGDAKLGDKYTNENFINSTRKVLTKYVT